MTGALDTRMRALAERLASKYGKAVTLRRASSTYDPTTGKSSETTTDHSVDATPPRPYAEREIDGTRVQAGDMRIGLPASALTVEPDTGTDVLVMDSEVWQVVAVEQVWSGEQVAMYELQVRK